MVRVKAPGRNRDGLRLVNLALVLVLRVGAGDLDRVGAGRQGSAGRVRSGRGVAEPGDKRAHVGAAEDQPAPLADLIVVQPVDVRVGPGGDHRRVVLQILQRERVRHRHIMLVGARVLGSAGAAALRGEPGIGLLVAVEVRSADVEQIGLGADDRVRVEDVARHHRADRAARVDEVLLGQAAQRVESVALECLGDLQRQKFFGGLDDRVKDRQLGHIGNLDLVAPLLGNGGDLLDGHRFADRGNPFGERRERQRHPYITGRGVRGAAAFRERGRVGKLIDDELFPRQRQRFGIEKRNNVGLEVGSSVRRQRASPLHRPSGADQKVTFARRSSTA